jgi:hypothetical protein
VKSLGTRKKLISLVLAAVLLLVVVPVALAWPFGDVPVGYWAYNQIKRVAYLHITAGCGGGNYCPTRTITRAEMAVFVDNLTKAWTDQNEPYIFSVDNKNNGQGQSGDGIIAQSFAGTGLKGYSTEYRGVTGWAPTGVYGVSSAYSGQAIHGHGANVLTEGVLGTAAYGVGVYGISDGSSGNAVGVLGQTNGTWGLYSNDSLYVAGSCTGCTMAFVAQNADAGSLQVGDVVAASGVAPPLKGQQTPILRVQRAAASGSGALGVVQSRAEISTMEMQVLSGDSDRRDMIETRSVVEGEVIATEMQVPNVEFERETVEVANMVDGKVASGEYLFIVVQGLAQVRVDANAGIQAGDRLVAGDGGRAASATADLPTIGQAVEAVDADTGLVWVLVDLQ